MRYSFIRSAQLCEICAKEGLSVSEVMLRREMERSERSRDNIMADLRSAYSRSQRYFAGSAACLRPETKF